MPMNNNFKGIFYSNFAEEELKEAIRNTKVKKTAPTRQCFLNLFTT